MAEFGTSDNSRKPQKSAGGGEFDQFSAGYDGGYSHPLKGVMSKAPQDFVEIKVKRLIADFLRRKSVHCPRLLDFGCGVGWFMKCIRQLQFACQLVGCDVSEGMLAEAAERWEDGELPSLVLIRDNKLPFDNESFDVVVACCVFHHIPPEERGDCFSEIARVLKPGGFFYLFEHNPSNPVIRYLIRHTPIDRNALLVNPGEVETGVRRVGLHVAAKDFFLFVPPRCNLLSCLEKYIAWLPLGGQYQVVSRKPLPEG